MNAGIPRTPKSLNYDGMTNRIFWQVDTRAISPRTVQILRGETVRLDVNLVSYGAPVDLSDASATAYWRSPDMASGSNWYTAPAEVDGNRVSWSWDGATMDAGASGYDFYIGVDGDGLSYRPCGKIEMLGSPAGNPSAVPIPEPVLDFAKYEILNSPFPTFAEEGTAIQAATSALAPVSALGAYYTAVETEQAIERGTSAKADNAALSAYLPLSGGTVSGSLSAGSLYAGELHLDFPGVILSDWRWFGFPGAETAPDGGTFAIVADVEAATSGKADRSDLSRYLPASGGTVSGPLTVNASASTGPATVRGDLVTQGANRFTQPLSTPALYYDNGAYLLVPANEQTDTIATRGEISAAVGTIQQALSGKQNILTFDAQPSANSTNPVYSGGVYSYIQNTLGDINTQLETI